MTRFSKSRGRAWLPGAAMIAAVAMAAGIASARSEAPPPKSIVVTARRFEFVPSTISLTRGESVSLRLTSDDVRHGFFQKSLGIDSEFVPGETKEILVTPREAGTFTVICDRFCGTGHGGMKLTIVVADGREP